MTKDQAETYARTLRPDGRQALNALFFKVEALYEQQGVDFLIDVTPDNKKVRFCVGDEKPVHLQGDDCYDLARQVRARWNL